MDGQVAGYYVGPVRASFHRAIHDKYFKNIFANWTSPRDYVTALILDVRFVKVTEVSKFAWAAGQLDCCSTMWELLEMDRE